MRCILLYTLFLASPMVRPVAETVSTLSPWVTTLCHAPRGPGMKSMTSGSILLSPKIGNPL